MKFTWETILTVAGGATILITAWQLVISVINKHKPICSVRFSRIEAAAESHERRIAELEKKTGEIEVTLAGMIADIGHIKGRVNEILEELRKR